MLFHFMDMHKLHVTIVVLANLGPAAADAINVKYVVMSRVDVMITLNNSFLSKTSPPSTLLTLLYQFPRSFLYLSSRFPGRPDQ